MKIPTITGVIRRRILLNYRISPERVQAVIPDRFRPKLVGDCSIGGICLIRLEQIRPKGFPRVMGIASENSAHRFAVEWEDANGNLKEGVFVLRRDTDSRMNAVAGGRIFPGVHNQSRFAVNDSKGKIEMAVHTKGHETPLVDLRVSEVDEFPKSSVLGSLKESSHFFESGCVGYSPGSDSCTLDGMMLKVADWKVSCLKVHNVQSSFFDDTSVFPKEEIEFDHALLMRDIPHEWHSEPKMNVGGSDSKCRPDAR